MLPRPVFAQTEVILEPLDFDIPAADPIGLISTGSALTLEPYQFNLGWTHQYVRSPLDAMYPRTQSPEANLTWRYRSDLHVSFAPIEGVQFSATAPFMLDQSLEGGSSGFSEGAAGFGDLVLRGRSTIYMKGERHSSRGGPTAIALEPAVYLATGTPETVSGGGRRRLALGILGETSMGGLRLLGNGIFRLSQRQGESASFNDQRDLILKAGGELGLVPFRLKTQVEAVATVPLGGLLGRPTGIHSTLLGGLTYLLRGGGSVSLEAGLGLYPGEAPTPRLLLSYHQLLPPNSIDRDGDGLSDAQDRCPTRREDIDGFRDLDGCPDPDNDEDGLLDGVDQCPMQPEDVDGFEDQDGCPDPDNDGDGLDDDRDLCPDDAEDRDHFKDEDGCPDLDNDQDGMEDLSDECPLAPEDYDSFQDEDGCPEPDNDADAILDVVDQCPNSAEDFDGFQDGDGCPERDNDKDGVLDGDDLCPDIPEDTDGSSALDGCPSAMPLLWLEDESAWLLLERVEFNPTDEVILERSLRALRLLAEKMKEAPTAATFLVQCYTDNRGDSQLNFQRSAIRADAVKRFLTESGIARHRIDAAGYGEAYPRHVGSSRHSRPLNRRTQVKMRMVEDGSPIPIKP